MNDMIERAAPAEDFAKFLMAALTNRDIPADKLQILLQMRREVLADQARERFQEAFAAFSAELPPVERDGMVDLGSKGKYAFTTYEQMDSILRPLLTKHGLALHFSSRDDDKSVIVTGTLAGHGWERSSTMALPPDTGPGRNALQARGSAHTYAHRYLADDLCNVVRKGVDNDGRLTAENYIDAKQLKVLGDLLKQTATDEQKFLNTMITGVPVLADVKARDYPRLELALREKLKRTVRKEASK